MSRSMPKDRGGAARARLTGARRARRLAVSGIAVLAATLLVGTALTTGARAAAVHKVPFQRGITVGEWGRSAYNPASFSHTIRHLKRTTKNNSVTLFPVWMMSSPTATDIHPTGAVSRANLVAAIRAAKKRNDSVILRPYLDVADGSWR